MTVQPFLRRELLRSDRLQQAFDAKEDQLPGAPLTAADIVNNLLSELADKVLAAAQGKALKDLIDFKQDALGYTPVNKAGDAMTSFLSLHADPTSNLHAATKQYVDTLAAGLQPKVAVRAATTANITLSGAQTIDGVSIVATDRVLVKNQTAPAENGLYVAAAGAWARASDGDSWAELVGALVPVSAGGTVHGGAVWVATIAGGGTLDTTAVVFTQFLSGASGVTSFASRSGAVSPANDDYTAGMLAVIATLTILGNSTGGSARPAAISMTTLKTMLAMTVASITDMTANGRSLVTAANYAAMRGLLDLEAGTDFYSKAAADAAFAVIGHSHAGTYAAVSHTHSYVEGVRLGTAGTTTITTSSGEKDLAAGLVLFGIRLTSDGKGGTFMDGLRYKPLQQQINGSWATVSG